MGCEQKGQGTALLLDSTEGSQRKGQSQLQGCVLKGKDVSSPAPLLPAGWNDDVKTGAGAVTLLHPLHMGSTCQGWQHHGRSPDP